MRRLVRPRSLVVVAAALCLPFLAPVHASAASPLGLNKTPQARITGQVAGVHTGDTLTYSGASSSDPDGKIASYAWSVGSGAAIVGSTTSPTVAVRFDSAGPASIVLTVVDNGLLNGLLGPLFTESGSTSASFTVTAPPNRAPVFLADRIAQPQTAPRGYFISSNLSFMDPDGDDVSVVSVVCERCRQATTIYTNSNNAGTTNEQIEGYTIYLPCLPQNVGIVITIDDGHGHQLTKYRSAIAYSGPAYSCNP